MGRQEFAKFFVELEEKVWRNRMWKEAARGSHKVLMGHLAGLGDGMLYANWDFGARASLQTNLEASYWAELVCDFTKLSDFHRRTAVDEAQCFKNKYNDLDPRKYGWEVFRQALLKEPIVDIGVESVNWTRVGVV